MYKENEVYRKLEVIVLVVLNIVFYAFLQYIVLGTFALAQIGGGPYLSHYIFLAFPLIFLIPLFIIRLQRKGFLKAGLFMILFLILDLYLSLIAVKEYPSFMLVYSMPFFLFFLHTYILIKSFPEKRAKIVTTFIVILVLIIFILFFYNKGSRLERDSKKCFLNNDLRDLEECIFGLGHSYISDSGKIVYNEAEDICKNANDRIISVWDELQGEEFIVSKRDFCYYEIADYIAFQKEFNREINTKDVIAVCKLIKDISLTDDCLNDIRIRLSFDSFELREICGSISSSDIRANCLQDYRVVKD